jgi:outer membrane protein assembly factor BamB
VVQIAGEGGIPDDPRRIARDAAGDVLAAGSVDVTKYSGAGGSPLWRRRIFADDVKRGFIPGIAVDGHGDVVVSGWSTPDVSDPQVVKLSGATGDVLWRVGVDAGDVSSLARPLVTPDDDVVVPGVTSGDLMALELAGATGARRWLTVVADAAVASELLHAAAVDEAGDVALAGQALTAEGNRFVVAKLSGGDGNLAWRVLVGTTSGEATTVAFAPGGDVVAAGRMLVGDGPAPSFATVRLAGADGGELWRRTPVPGRASTIAIGAYESSCMPPSRGDARVGHFRTLRTPCSVSTRGMASGSKRGN